MFSNSVKLVILLTRCPSFLHDQSLSSRISYFLASEEWLNETLGRYLDAAVSLSYFILITDFYYPSNKKANAHSFQVMHSHKISLIWQPLFNLLQQYLCFPKQNVYSPFTAGYLSQLRLYRTQTLPLDNTLTLIHVPLTRSYHILSIV